MKYILMAIFLISVVGCGDEIYNEIYNTNTCFCQRGGGDVCEGEDVLTPRKDAMNCGPWGCDIHYMDFAPDVETEMSEVTPYDTPIDDNVSDVIFTEVVDDTVNDSTIAPDLATTDITDPLETIDDVSVVDTDNPEDVILPDVTIPDITDPPETCEHSWQCFDDDTCTINFCLWGKCREHPVCFWGFYCEPIDGFPACLRECTADDDCPTDKWCNSGRCEIIPECTTNADCATDEWCDAGKCRVNPSLTHCVISCPKDSPTAVVWYGSGAERCVMNGEPFIVDFSDGYCSWAIDQPTFKFNCTTNATCDLATTGWGDGDRAAVECDVETLNEPDPQQGNFGKRVVTMPGIKCSDLNL